jgi:hypothetical protein
MAKTDGECNVICGFLSYLWEKTLHAKIVALVVSKATYCAVPNVESEVRVSLLQIRSKSLEFRKKQLLDLFNNWMHRRDCTGLLSINISNEAGVVNWILSGRMRQCQCHSSG